MPRRSDVQEKPRDRKGTLIRLGKYMAQYKMLMLLALVLTVGSNLLQLLGPMLSGYAINAIEPGACKVDFGLDAGFLSGQFASVLRAVRADGVHQPKNRGAHAQGRV